ncbi:MAG TPA: helix-turn-helix domain-containing protein [Acidobacteriota bacterium]|nr:helix-turn-helix domain-containing protein [Acidobacteriota bacterium]
MHFRELVPRPQLRPYVRLIWVLEVDQAESFGSPERVVPDGLVEVVFHWRTPLVCRYDGEEFARQPRSVAVSQTRRFVEFRPEGACGFISARFHPWGACHFLGLPVSEVADSQVDAESLWGHATRELEAKLAGASGYRERVELLERFLLAQLHRHHKEQVEPLVREVWRRKGDLRIPQLCRDLGFSERGLERTFTSSLGMTPKRFARLTRFLHSCRQVRDRRRTPLTEIAQNCGYYDQSHFNAEFKSFSGMTPRQFRATQNVSFLEID